MLKNRFYVNKCNSREQQADTRTPETFIPSHLYSSVNKFVDFQFYLALEVGTHQVNFV